MTPAILKVMIVEDEAVTAMATRLVLSKLDCETCGIAASGEEALEIARAQRPDVVLMDIMLDGELDGVETAREIIRKYDVPIIFTTAYTDEATRSRATETGPLAFLAKPVDHDDLRSVLRPLFSGV